MKTFSEYLNESVVSNVTVGEMIEKALKYGTQSQYHSRCGCFVSTVRNGRIKITDTRAFGKKKRGVVDVYEIRVDANDVNLLVTELFDNCDNHVIYNKEKISITKVFNYFKLKDIEAITLCELNKLNVVKTLDSLLLIAHNKHDITAIGYREGKISSDELKKDESTRIRLCNRIAPFGYGYKSQKVYHKENDGSIPFDGGGYTIYIK